MALTDPDPPQDKPQPSESNTTSSIFFPEKGCKNTKPIKPNPNRFEYKGPSARPKGLLQRLRDQRKKKTEDEEEGKETSLQQTLEDIRSEPSAENQVQQHQKLYNEFVKRRVKKIKTIHHYLTDAEILTAIEKSSNDEDEAAIRLIDIGFLNEVRKTIAMKEQEKVARLKDQESLLLPKNRTLSASSPSKAHHNRQNRKLRLDDALKQNNYEGWSEARIKAYQLIHTNPNAYYYRFNEPGVEQRNGKWTEEEKKLFFDRVKEIGVNGQWGVFSQTIPGRVGYQCSNFYRLLIQSGEIEDPKYELDSKGKARYKFKNGTKKRKKEEEEEEEEDDKPVVIKKKKRPAKKKVSDDDDEYCPSVSKTAKAQAQDREEELASNNPLVGYIDPITCEEIEQPCISPYGHVLGKQTWLRCLDREPRNVCPFTKKPLRKRELVQLTMENIEEYRDKIDIS